jgi:hypothetical protein
MGEKIDGFQKARLARSVGTDDSGPLSVKLDARVANAAKILDLKRR